MCLDQVPSHSASFVTTFQSAEFSPPPVLDGFFLLKHCCVDDPADLCVFNVVDKGLVEANKEDLNLFINVAIVNAGRRMSDEGIVELSFSETVHRLTHCNALLKSSVHHVPYRRRSPQAKIFFPSTFLRPFLVCESWNFL